MSFVEMLVLSAGRPHYYDRYVPTPCSWHLLIHEALCPTWSSCFCSDTSSPNTADLLDFVTLEVMADSSSQPAPVDELDALAKNYIGSGRHPAITIYHYSGSK